MRSIRRTLLSIVLCVMVITLGGVTILVYRLAVDSLRDKERAAKDLVEKRYNDLQDEELRNRAEILARDVQQKFQGDKWWLRWQIAAAGGMTAPVPAGAPSAQHTLLTSLATWLHNNRITYELNTRFATELTLAEEETYHNNEFEFVQMTANWGASWKSRSLGGYSLPIDIAIVQREFDPKPSWDNVTLPDGTILRRVIIRSPVMRYGRPGAMPGYGRSRRDDGPSPTRAVVGIAGAARGMGSRGGPSGRTIIAPVPTGTGDFTLPTFSLQCAWDTSANNPLFREKIENRDRQLAHIEAETNESINNLRATLAWTVLGAIAATLLIGWLLVGLGLSPLKRLSFAVSQISPKDFRLPINSSTLPAEINPVADRLSQALRQLQAAFEREKRAAADISHELRTPLAALTTTIEVACRKSRTAEQYRQVLNDCLGIAKQMSQLVERMLMLAWLDAGVDQVRKEAVEVGDLVTGVAAIGRPLAEAHGLSFRVNMAAPVTVKTDPNKVREAIMNLIHNAIEYNRPGGEVELTASPTSQGVALEVSDTGIGMSPDIMEKIFERFFRADQSRQATGVHAGLGLAIVKEYVDLLGGKLTVDSVVGSGSRFRIELPNAT